MKSLILDLRLNTGGALAASIEISDLFLPKGSLIVSTKGRNPAFDREFRAFADGQYEKLPLVILIDQGTASASEIVSGAVMDHDRGLIVGEDSWGKGLVQKVFALAPNMAVALTVAKYLTPSGRSIQRDYSQLDEYLMSKRAPENSREVRYTEHGRKVLGQGGITPDYAVNSILKPLTGRLRISGAFFAYARKLVLHQTDLGRKLVFPQEPKETGAAAAGKIQIGTPSSSMPTSSPISASTSRPARSLTRSPRSGRPSRRSAASSSARSPGPSGASTPGSRSPGKAIPSSSRRSRSCPKRPGSSTSK